MKTAFLYDGFPTFLPCKMIMQNPLVTPVSGSDWIKDFRTIDDNWNNITNTAYWKLISRVIGNIDIKSWSGDINIETEGSLGNAGNINLFANNKHGALPGYKVGNVQVTANTPFRVFTDPRDLFLDTHLMGKFYGQFAWFSTKPGQPPSKTPPAITVKPLNTVQMLLQLLGVPFQFGFTEINSNGGGCASCITDVITQMAVDLQLFTIVPWMITENLFLDDQLPYHNFNAAHKSFMHTDIIDGSVSILKKQSNGFGHAVDKFGLNEIYGNVEYGFGNILMNGVGSYDLRVGKNATFSAETNDWQFGVSSTVETDWIKPGKGINPLENLLGELNVAVPGEVCHPTIKKSEATYLNKFNKRIFGNYTATFNGLTDTGVYSIPTLIQGVMGYEQSEYIVDVPGEKLEVKELDNARSTSYKFENQPYTINTAIYDYYVSDDTVSIQGLAWGDSWGENPNTNIASGKYGEAVNSGLYSSFKLQFGNKHFPVITSGATKWCKLKDQLPNTAAAISMALSIIGALIKIIPLLGTLVGEGVKQVAKFIPNILMPEYNDLFLYSAYIFSFYDKQTYSIYIPIKSQTDFGICPWNISSEIMSGKPLVYNFNKFALPDIAPIADGLISIGSIVDPIGTLQKTFTEELPDALNQTELNTTLGLGGLPKVLVDALNMEELCSANIGLFPGCNLGATFNLFDSEQDRKALFTNFNIQFDVDKLPIPWVVVTEKFYALTCNIEGELTLPIFDGEVKVGILKETLGLTVGAPFPPRGILIIGGKEIINIPKGGAGVMGSGLIKAILDLFF